MTKNAQPGDLLLVVHEFIARSSDELSLAKGDKIELIERDDDFGDGWFLGRHIQNGHEGLFPEVYTTVAPKPTLSSTLKSRSPALAKPAAIDDAGAKTPPGSTAVAAAPTVPFSNGPASPEKTSPPSSSDVSPETNSFRSPAQINTTITNRATSQGSTVMNETLSVIEEHITDMNKPISNAPEPERRHSGDSTSLYSTNIDQQLSYIPGDETEDEEGQKLTKQEVQSWSPAAASNYLSDMGVEAHHCKIFQEQEFSGEVLLEMEQSSIFLKELDLGPVGRRLKTWQKIKALQDEVKPRKKLAPIISRKPLGATTPSETSRQSTPLGSGTTLPRIPHHMDGTTGDQGRFWNQSLAGRSETDLVPPSPTFGVPRPSAAGVRNLSHSRRHSSIDQTIRDSPDPTAHSKQASFDRNWTMGGTPGSANGLVRPTSAIHGASLSSDRAQLESPTIPGSDKGYSSGGEMDVKKTRNFLRKRDPQDHGRGESYSSEKRLSSTGLFSRSLHSSSPASTNRLSVQDGGNRIVSEPVAERTSPTVTKLQYEDHSSAMTGRYSGSKTNLADSLSSDANRKGLRATSDAVTKRERTLVSPPAQKSPADSSSITRSPTQTESSLPSSTTRSADYDDDKFELMNAATGLQGSAGTRRKPKKATSAYIRGLEKKTPQEQIEGCDYYGWMKKKSSNLMTTWKPRLFVLRGRRLSYYYDENDTEEKGLIDISNHRVLPADNDILTNMLAGLTGANSPNSPQKPSPTSPNSVEQKSPTNDSPSSPNKTGTGLSAGSAPSPVRKGSSAEDQTYIFKLLPPRSGLSKAVNFTKPTVHYFAVPSLEEGRLWMAAMIKATIDRDETIKVRTTYQQKTISLEKARARKERPPFLGGVVEEAKNDDGAERLTADTTGNDVLVTDSPMAYEPKTDPSALPGGPPISVKEKDAEAGVTQAVTNLEPPGSGETKATTPNGGRRWTLGGKRDSTKTRTERSPSEPGKGLGIEMGIDE